MADKTYGELLKDVRWQRKRLEILQRDNWTCQACKATEENEISLHVHHKQYKRGAKPWEYADAYLLTLCEQCHADATEKTKFIQDALRQINPSYFDEILGFIDGIVQITTNGHGVVYPLSAPYAHGIGASIGIPGEAVVSESYPFGTGNGGGGLPVDMKLLFKKRIDLWQEEVEIARAQEHGPPYDSGTDEVDF